MIDPADHELFQFAGSSEEVWTKLLARGLTAV